MASRKLRSFFFLFTICLVFVSTPGNAQGLTVGFYEKTCPKAELIVKKVVFDTMKVAPTLGAPLLRMFFHDCFVRGCDGSVLLDLPQSKKTAVPNLTLRGFQIIDRVKTAVEEECPGVVSCADILALVTRDAMVALHGPSWEVETGRRDGKVSNATEALLNIPSPFANIDQLVANFSAKGLNVKDLVVLSGGHTIGNSHCRPFSNRLYNFTGRGDMDPALDPNYAEKLKAKCAPNDQTTIVEMDPGSFRTFDESYFTLVAKRRGLFQSDAALLNHQQTKAYVFSQSLSHGASFFQDFAESMVKMGRIEVLTGKEGEVRKMCRKVN